MSGAIALPDPSGIAVMNTGEAVDARNDLAAMRDVYGRHKEHAAELVKVSALLVKVQRRLGELVKADIQRGGDPEERKVTLRDLGITKNQSSKWQRLAAIDTDEFERFVDSEAHDGECVTTAGTLRALEPKEPKPPDYKARLAALLKAWAETGVDAAVIADALRAAADAVEGVIEPPPEEPKKKATKKKATKKKAMKVEPIEEPDGDLPDDVAAALAAEYMEARSA